LQDDKRRELNEKIANLDSDRKKVELKVRESKSNREEAIMSAAEKKRLLFEDKKENEQRLKAMRQTFYQGIMERHQSKESKVREMRRVWLNKDRESIDTLYGVLNK
jgi:alpha-glucuronidase